MTGLPRFDEPVFAERAERFRADKTAYDAAPNAFFALPRRTCAAPRELLHHLVYGMSRRAYLHKHAAKTRGMSIEIEHADPSWGLHDGRCVDGTLGGPVDFVARYGRVERQTMFGMPPTVTEYRVEVRARATVEQGSIVEIHRRYERERIIMNHPDGTVRDLHGGWMVTFRYPSGVLGAPALSVRFRGSPPSSWVIWTREAVQPGIERRHKYLGPHLEMISHWSEAGPHGQSVVFDRAGREVNRFCHVDGEEFLTNGACPVSF